MGMPDFASRFFGLDKSHSTPRNRRDSPWARVPERIYQAPPTRPQKPARAVQSRGQSIQTLYPRHAKDCYDDPSKTEYDTNLNNAQPQLSRLPRVLTRSGYLTDVDQYTEDVSTQPRSPWLDPQNANVPDSDRNRVLSPSVSGSGTLFSDQLPDQDSAYSRSSGHGSRSGLVSSPLEQIDDDSPCPKPPPAAPSSHDPMIKLDDIGSGGEGNCSLWKRKEDKQLFVVKALVHKKPSVRNSVPDAVRIHDILGAYDRILELCAWEQTRGIPHLWHPYYDRGDLCDLFEAYVIRRKIPLPESFLWHAFIQLAEAIAYIHDGYDRHNPRAGPPLGWRQVIHRDIKPENVFMKSTTHSTYKYPHLITSGYPDLVLADFGLATTEPFTGHRARHPDCERKSPVGTACYQGPETPLCSRAGDIWSLGAVMHLLSTGKLPLKQKPRFKPFSLMRMKTLEWEEDSGAREVKRLDKTEMGRKGG
ncbi:MAG: hypothetical protein Q9190_000423, partial [Brigantiaea leucoxantha]